MFPSFPNVNLIVFLLFYGGNLNIFDFLTADDTKQDILITLNLEDCDGVNAVDIKIKDSIDLCFEKLKAPPTTDISALPNTNLE